MIYFPSDLTPVPHHPGYFWDVKKHKMYSLKVGGVLREMKLQKVNPYMLRYGSWRGGLSIGEPFYALSKNGQRRTMLVRNLKKLKLVDYDMPVVNRSKENA